LSWRISVRRTFPVGDVNRHTQEGRLAGARCHEGKFDCLEEARPPGAVSQTVLPGSTWAAPGEPFSVVPHERFCLGPVRHQVQVGAADHLLWRQAIGFSASAVGKQVAAFWRLGEMKCGSKVHHQAQQTLALAQCLLGVLRSVISMRIPIDPVACLVYPRFNRAVRDPALLAISRRDDTNRFAIA